MRAAFGRLRLPFRRGTLERYRAINADLWRRYTEGRATGQHVAVERFRLAVVTNGYERVQRSRLRAARLLRHFDAIVTSEGAGVSKPHPGIVNEMQPGYEHEDGRTGHEHGGEAAEVHGTITGGAVVTAHW